MGFYRKKYTHAAANTASSTGTTNIISSTVGEISYNTSSTAISISGSSDVGDITMQAGGVTISGTSTVGNITKTSGNVTISGTSTVGNITTTSGNVTLNDTSEAGDIVMGGNGSILTLAAGTTVGHITTAGANLALKAGTVKGITSTNANANIYTNASGVSGNLTLEDSISIKNGETAVATFTAREGDASLSHARFTGYTSLKRDGSTATLDNVDVTISGNYQMGNVTLSHSTLTVESGATLTSVSDGGLTTLDAVVIEAGGKLAETSSNSFAYNGNVALTLNAASIAGDAATGFTTAVLPGTMNANSSLTLAFANDVTAPFEGTSFALTFTGLTGASTLGLDDFVVSALEQGWALAEVSAAATGTGTTLTFSYTSASIPEPATATLSLLVLAGLAARRRRR